MQDIWITTGGRRSPKYSDREKTPKRKSNRKKSKRKMKLKKILIKSLNMSEDCLTLNIFAPVSGYS